MACLGTDEGPPGPRVLPRFDRDRLGNGRAGPAGARGRYLIRDRGSGIPVTSRTPPGPVQPGSVIFPVTSPGGSSSLTRLEYGEELKRYRMRGNRIAIVTDHDADLIEVHSPSRGRVDLGGLTVERCPPMMAMG